MTPLVYSSIPDETHCAECAEGDGCAYAQRAWAEEEAAHQAWLKEQAPPLAEGARTDPDPDDLPFD